MIANYRLKLFITLLLFAIITSFTILTIDYFRIIDRTLKNNEVQLEQVTESVKYALNTVDKAYFYLDDEVTMRMTENTYELQEKYEKNPNFTEWDFDSLAAEMDMDIFILDEGNKIVYSNDETEIGLDFSICCESFNRILNDRRISGELYVDGIDLEQQSGEVKKFSYMATSDKKYIIELGYALKNEPIFQEFDFLKVSEELTEQFSLIEQLHVLNLGGRPFGLNDTETFVPERRKGFVAARDSFETVEIEGEYNGKGVIFRYVPYQSEYDLGSTNTKVVEIIYHNQELLDILQENKQLYLFQLLIIFIVTIFVSSLIAKWFAKPMYLAYHDSLTGLKNRASFDDHLSRALTKDKKQTQVALLMLDLDNFKLVNDYFGHGKGDYLLTFIGQKIKATVGNRHDVFRLGGDEFAVIIKNTNKEDVEKVAQKIIDTLSEELQYEKDINRLSISVSIGIAIADNNESPALLYNNADIALYESKEKGKNQYQFFQKESTPGIPFMNK